MSQVLTSWEGKRGVGCGGSVVVEKTAEGGGSVAGMNPEAIPADVERVMAATSGLEPRGADDPPRGYRKDHDTRYSKGGSVWGTGKNAGPGESADGKHNFGASALFPDDEEDAAPFGFNGRYKTSVSLSSSAVAALLSDQAGSASNSSSFLRMVVVAGARVDSAWAKPKRPGVMPKNEPPISHVVKARTISGYKASNGGLKIEGQTWWFSERRCVRLVGLPNKASDAKKASGESSGSVPGSAGISDGDSSAEKNRSTSPSSGMGESGGTNLASGSGVDGEERDTVLSDGMASAGLLTTMLVTTGATACVVLCIVTAMHSRGVLAECGGGGDRHASRAMSAKKGRARRRSSQMNELSPLKEVEKEGTDTV